MEKINIKELKEKNNLTELNNAYIKSIIEWKQREGSGKRAIKNYLIKENARRLEFKNQKHIKNMTITIEWKKSRTWGANPHAEIKGQYIDGTFFRDDGFSCSGCGYDKASTVLSQIFNKYLRYKLIATAKSKKKKEAFPYGAYFRKDSLPSFEYGVGVSCYQNMTKALGGKFQYITSTNTLDVYYIEFKK